MVVNDRGCSEPPKPGCVGAITRARSARRSSTGRRRIEPDAGMQEQERPPAALSTASMRMPLTLSDGERNVLCRHRDRPGASCGDFHPIPLLYYGKSASANEIPSAALQDELAASLQQADRAVQDLVTDDQNFELRKNLAYANHDGVELTGDLYLPAGPGPFPVIVNVHGGYWRRGSRDTFQHWGPYLAAARLCRLHDQLPADQARQEDLSGAWCTTCAPRCSSCAAARRNSGSIPTASRSGAIPPARIWPRWWRSPATARCLRAAIRRTRYASVSTKVKVLIGVYGIYDLLAQWRHSQIGNPGDNLVECFLGASPMQDRRSISRRRRSATPPPPTTRPRST